jgi:hypothetical protein
MVPAPSVSETTNCDAGVPTCVAHCRSPPPVDNPETVPDESVTDTSGPRTLIVETVCPLGVAV